MITIVFELDRRSIDYTWYNGNGREPLRTGSVDRCRIHSSREALELMLADVRSKAKPAGDARPDVIAIRVPFGGAGFREPVVVDAKVLTQFDDLTPHAPIHLPAIAALVEGCQQVFAGAPIVALFDTSFFVDLPAKEYLYAVDAEVTRSLQLRRYGYHGILHQAACGHAMREQPGRARRLLSICLESRLEVAAILEGRPVMVTGGATPLEGLPGERSSGDIDPGIILTLAQKGDQGLEQINKVLTQRSGVLGLVGEPVDLPTIFTQREDPRYELARRVIRYRLLLACGAGVAAMGGVDRIVFSGRYHAIGETVGPWLVSKLSFAEQSGGKRLSWCSFTETVERVIADAARRVAVG
jgi:acetate kinase